MKKESFFFSQTIPLLIAFLSTIVFLLILVANTHLLNTLFPHEPIQFIFHPWDLALGLYLYLKTSVDFAVFIAAMMVANPGWKKRVAVEWGTSFGNFAGTIAIIWVWTIFRSIGPVFEGIIVIIASFVLLELAAGSLSRLKSAQWDTQHGFKKAFFSLSQLALKIRRLTAPFLGWMPDVEGAMAGRKVATLGALLLFAVSVPFILGSDDFAGYISVFSVVNVLSFATGVILGHGLLLAAMFAIPSAVETIMDNPWFSALAVTTFLAIFTLGTYDGSRLLLAWGQTNLPLFLMILTLAISWSLSQKVRQTVSTAFSRAQESAFRLLTQLLKNLKIVSPQKATALEEKEAKAIHRRLFHYTRQAVITGWQKTRATALRLAKNISKR